MVNTGAAGPLGSDTIRPPTCPRLLCTGVLAAPLRPACHRDDPVGTSARNVTVRAPERPAAAGSWTVGAPSTPDDIAPSTPAETRSASGAHFAGSSASCPSANRARKDLLNIYRRAVAQRTADNQFINEDALMDGLMQSGCRLMHR